MTSQDAITGNLNNILVVFDSVGCDTVSIQTVFQLATQLNLGLQVLYIEDVNLLDTVELPFTREISMHSAEIVPLDTRSIMQQLRSEADKLKQQIEFKAQSLQLSYSFNSVRGEIIQVVKNRINEVRFLFIPAVYSSSGMKSKQNIKQTVALVYDMSSHSKDTALNIAINYAKKIHAQLFILTNQESSIAHIQKSVLGHGVNAICQLLDISHLDAVVSVLIKHLPDLVVMSEDSYFKLEDDSSKSSVQSLEADILLLR